MTTPTATLLQRLASFSESMPLALAISARDERGRWNQITWADLYSAVLGASIDARNQPSSDRLLDGTNGAKLIIDVLACWSALGTPCVTAPTITVDERSKMMEGLQLPGAKHLPTSSEAITSTTAATTSSQGGPATPRRIDTVAWRLPSGGTTGGAKFVAVFGSPVTILVSQQLLMQQMKWSPTSVQLVMGPLHHAAAFTAAFAGLLAGNHLVVLSKFDLRAVEEAAIKFKPTWLQTTPHQMRSMLVRPSLMKLLGSLLDGMMHTAAPCPEDLKRDWMKYISPERTFELYGSTQMVGAVISRGDDWLRHPGTVGKPFMTQVQILDEAGHALPPGQVGKVFMRSSRTRLTSRQSVRGVQRRPGGFSSVGDLGYLDEDGFLYLSGRQDDTINVGGEKVSAHVIEAAIKNHPYVRDCVVFGQRDTLLGARVVAIVEMADSRDGTIEELRDHCKARLPREAVPSVIRSVPSLKRSPAGKVERFGYSEII